MWDSLFRRLTVVLAPGQLRVDGVQLAWDDNVGCAVGASGEAASNVTAVVEAFGDDADADEDHTRADGRGHSYEVAVAVDDVVDRADACRHTVVVLAGRLYQ